MSVYMPQVKEARRSFAKIIEACIKSNDPWLVHIVLLNLTACIEQMKAYIAEQQRDMAGKERLNDA